MKAKMLPGAKETTRCWRSRMRCSAVRPKRIQFSIRPLTHSRSTCVSSLMRFVRGQSEIKWDAKSRAARRPPHVAAAMAVAARANERVHAVTLGAACARTPLRPGSCRRYGRSALVGMQRRQEALRHERADLCSEFGNERLDG